MKKIFTQSKLSELVEETKKELKTIGIEPQGKVTYKVNTTAKRRLGQCKRLGQKIDSEYVHIISISKIFAEASTEKEIKNIIIHEILHTYHMNHGSEWKSMAERVNKGLGYNISRTNVNKGAESQYKYRITCECCGARWHRMKITDFITNYQNYNCRACGKEKGRLKREILR